MLNFRNTNIFFIILLVILIGIHSRYGFPFYSYFLLLFLYSLVIFYGCINIGAGFFIKVICSANTNKKEIAISFDDGPAANHTTAILSILQKENVKATFFCIGNRIPGNEDIVRQVSAHCHIIGNHSYTHHFWFDLFSSKKMLDDMRQMDHQLEQLTGHKPVLFRPPYGVTNPNLKKAIISGGYTPVGWSVRSMDTVTKDEKKLLSKVTEGIKPGAVFLFHDTCSITLNVLPSFLEEVKKRGYQVVPLDKLLHLKPYA